MDKINEAKKIFLLSDDIDSETYAENLEMVTEWEHDLIELQNFQSWQEHEVTRQIMKKAGEVYLDCATRLATRRDLSDLERQSLWAKQDACLLMISWADGNPKDSIDRLMAKVTYALEHR